MGNRQREAKYPHGNLHTSPSCPPQQGLYLLADRPVNLTWGETPAFQLGRSLTNCYKSGSCLFCCLCIFRKAGGWLFCFIFKFHKCKKNGDGGILGHINHLVWKFPSWNILFTLWKTEIIWFWFFSEQKLRQLSVFVLKVGGRGEYLLVFFFEILESGELILTIPLLNISPELHQKREQCFELVFLQNWGDRAAWQVFLSCSWRLWREHTDI